MEQWRTPNLVDVAALIFLLLGVAGGYRRRLSGELAPMVSSVAAVVAAYYGFASVAEWLRAHSALSGQTARAVAFSSVATVVFLSMLILRSIFGKVMKVVIEDRTDRALGCLAGLIRSIAMTAIVFAVVLMTGQPYLHRQFGEESVIGRQLIRSFPSLSAPAEPGREPGADARPLSEPAA